MSNHAHTVNAEHYHSVGILRAVWRWIVHGGHRP